MPFPLRRARPAASAAGVLRAPVRPRGAARRASGSRGQCGQASVELVALLPLMAALLALAWQAAVAGQAVWLAGGAARAAARAHAIGGDAAAGARATLPPGLRAGLRVRAGEDGRVVVRLGIPVVAAGGSRLGTVSREAHFAPQGKP